MAPEWNFKDWYKDNSTDLNKDRRSRYETDPDYRERVLETNRASRERQRQARLKEQAKAKKAKKVVVKKAPWKEVSVETGAATPQKLYTIGYLATALGRSVQVIRLWEKQGVIPPTPLKSAKGDRMYTPEMIDSIHEILEKKGRLKENTRGKRRPLKAVIRLNDSTTIETPVFRIGKVAAALGKSVVTLEQMERNGTIPPTPFRTSADHRLFTGPMIESLKTVFDGAHDGEGLTPAVIKGWSKLGLVGPNVALLAVEQVTEDSDETEDAG